MAVLDFKRSLITPSTLAKGTLQFVDVGGRFKMLIGDNSNNPREANYLPFGGGVLSGSLTLDTNVASPLILTRSGGSVGINLNGSYLGNAGGVLRFGSSTTHANNNEIWHSGTLKISNPTIEATAALVIPTVAPVNPDPNKVYLYLT